MLIIIGHICEKFIFHVLHELSSRLGRIADIDEVEYSDEEMLQVFVYQMSLTLLC